ncbi:MAG: cell envelope integrity protein CreD [Elusimicrobia bacterium]|jgi:inner membrane protein|nr:cell envelope integrity protein CreD [Elusimicrobiota bacterium]MBK7545718.1 cell envelope integrity protein CreD [Elusimicrobiota bacterium]MBK7574982.1 cell envelope integrity protein CreD [Elusimicrobiota bacterium]MBK7687752.1 cell envelope integrity protein CreD [Elusimicrobiota bacterium]MBK8125327.1 cell envelope integrity protein CreD [Elusimicrobiota bacterium]
MSQNAPQHPVARWLRTSVGLKIFVLGFLLLVLLIPVQMIKSLLRERKNARGGVLDEIAAKWGAPQTWTGPWLTVPYSVGVPGPRGETLVGTAHAAFLPETLTIDGDVATEKRRRGLYETIVYSLKADVAATFGPPHIGALGLAEDRMRWKEARLCLGLSDVKGVRSVLSLKRGGAVVVFEPGIHGLGPVVSGACAPVPLTAKSSETFSFPVHLNGSGFLGFSPVGKTNDVRLRSAWPSPSFQGAFLPVERAVGPSGFSAGWSVLHFNRNFPQQWTTKDLEQWAGLGNPFQAGDGSVFGVRLEIPVDQYQSTERASKYAVLILMVTLFSAFVMEVVGRRPAHPVQYLLIGLALVFFFSLLLALSEKIGFAGAYVSAAVSVVAMIGFYARAVFASVKSGAVMAGVLSVLYAFLYVLLQMEDNAFLVGNLALGVLLGVSMVLTRRVDWFRSAPDSDAN